MPDSRYQEDHFRWDVENLKDDISNVQSLKYVKNIKKDMKLMTREFSYKGTQASYKSLASSHYGLSLFQVSDPLFLTQGNGTKLLEQSDMVRLKLPGMN